MFPIPDKYASGKTTDLEITIAGAAQVFDIDKPDKIDMSGGAGAGLTKPGGGAGLGKTGGPGGGGLTKPGGGGLIKPGGGAGMPGGSGMPKK